ncbi:MAG: glycerophosphodiester phosphodiesterase [Gammaproteobacteria bacterium]|nr:glycerophosphodiester phosphodiesterase [Gammaproteobacteria bacterium]MBU0772800.1 glycerophosphodiester phosphodiesterase [Gammaproteobacteria bacterium]MBU0856534.1 glycerophosphodiester phosphodiesterase [Gammaproteobacteria bacterium]MBU1847572.1 glycerophosphodiester phosphodiesterase [Gammaproteobacteria bacterium]
MTDWPYPLWIAHRGGGGAAPENTLAALRTGAAAGFRMVEFDVMLSRDGVPVLMHDETLDRTTNGQGNVNSRDCAELERLDAGSRHGAAFAGERIPTLATALDTLLSLGLAANIEIKPAAGFERETGEVAARLVAARWPGTAVPPLLSSFSQVALAAAREEAPGLPRGLLFDDVPDDWPAQLAAHEAVSLHCNEAALDDATLRALRAAGVPVLCYTVNDGVRAQALIAAGVAGLFTDSLELPSRLQG